MPKPFFVLATQNPIEQEGTYPLPEAQLDRFMFNVLLDYPNYDEELRIVKIDATLVLGFLSIMVIAISSIATNTWKIITNLKETFEPFGCLRRGVHVTVLIKQTNKEISGEFLGRLVLGEEDGAIKVFGATIY